MPAQRHFPSLYSYSLKSRLSLHKTMTKFIALVLWLNSCFVFFNFLCKTQGGQNVRIVRIFYFVTLKLYGLYGFFFKLYGLYGFLSWKYTVFLIFTHFSKFFMKISKKNSRQNEVSFPYFLHSK